MKAAKGKPQVLTAGGRAATSAVVSRMGTSGLGHARSSSRDLATDPLPHRAPRRSAAGRAHQHGFRDGAHRQGRDEFHRTFASHPSLAPTFRKSLTQYLAAHRIDDTMVRQVVLCADEAFINAVEHAADSLVSVSASIRDGELMLDVTDGGLGFDPDRLDHEGVPDLLAEHGRGLFLIRNLADELEVLSGERGTTLRMKLALPDVCSQSAHQTMRVA